MSSSPIMVHSKQLKANIPTLYQSLADTMRTCRLIETELISDADYVRSHSMTIGTCSLLSIEKCSMIYQLN